MKKLNNKYIKKDTSWNEVSTWYDDMLEKDKDTYQSKVIEPNLLRILNIQKGDKIFDVACGQGYFSGLFASQGASVVASDLSKNLIKTAKEKYKNNKNIVFYNSSADRSPFVIDNSIDKIVIVLAIQNISNPNDVFKECFNKLKKGGTLTVVLNHPSFRIPQASDWYFHEGVQSRIVSSYMSERKIDIDMNPSEKNPKKKIFTQSFHRPLQYYMKIFSKIGFVMTRLEEWISHKESGTGPRKAAEDKARKEIPMFMCVEVKKL